jgi:hypothetical protein
MNSFLNGPNVTILSIYMTYTCLLYQYIIISTNHIDIIYEDAKNLYSEIEQQLIFHNLCTMFELAVSMRTLVQYSDVRYDFAYKQCLVRLYLQLDLGGPMPCLRYLCLFVCLFVQHYVANFSGFFDCSFGIL